jgi:hypothetical protein
MQEIIFTNMSELPLQPPMPCSKQIPDWYKKLESYMGGKKKPNFNAQTTATIKRCIPVFDSITAGYLITTPVDIYVRLKDGAPFYSWPTYGPIEFHPLEQAPLHPLSQGVNYPKFLNPWSIRTPKGYSVLITQPMHRESPFKILDGIVDTDTYTNSINFPFQLLDINFEGLIPQGTPMAQVIPFKRTNWQMKIGDKRDLENAFAHRHQIVMKYFDKYKNDYWSKKEYK